MKLSDWARQQGVTYPIVWRWVRDGKMPVPVGQLASGTWIVEEAPAAAGRVGYCCVSSGGQRSDLDRQTVRVVEGANAQGLAVAEIVAVIVVEHKDRLARFGVEHLQAALAAAGRRLVILEPEESTDDLVKDMADVLTSMCARLYGQRAAKNRAARALAAATGEESSG